MPQLENECELVPRSGLTPLTEEEVRAVAHRLSGEVSGRAVWPEGRPGPNERLGPPENSCSGRVDAQELADIAHRMNAYWDGIAWRIQPKHGVRVKVFALIGRMLGIHFKVDGRPYGARYQDRAVLFNHSPQSTERLAQSS